ncbi:hypothetical protein D9M70_300060 [compost metagenome]
MVGIGAIATNQGIRALASIEYVGGTASREPVVVVRTGQVLDRQQGIGARAPRGLGRGERQAGSDGAAGIGIGAGIHASTAVEHIVAAAGEERVGQAVTGQIGGPGGEDPPLFDVGAEGVGRQVAVDQVAPPGAGARIGFDHQIAGIVDVVGIGAIPPNEGIRASATIEHVGTCAAGKPIAIVGSHQILDRDQGVSARAPRRLSRGDRQADCDGAAGIGIGGGINASAAVEHIVAAAGKEGVGQAVAGQVGGPGGEDATLFDVSGQGVGRHVAVDRIGAASTGRGVGFTDDIAGILDVIDIGAIATNHRVRALTSIEHVGGTASRESVVVVRTGQVLDPQKGVGARAPRGLGRSDRQADSDGAACIDIGEAIDPGAAVEHIVAAAGEERVGQAIAGQVGGAGGEDTALLDIGTEDIARQVAVNRIDTTDTGGGVGLANTIASVVDIVRIGAIATNHHIGAGAAIEHVGGTVANELISKPAANNIFDADKTVGKVENRIFHGRNKIAITVD